MSILATVRKDAADVKAFILKVVGKAPAIVQSAVAAEESLAPVVEAFVPGSAAIVGVVDRLLVLAEGAVTAAGSAASQPLNVALDTALVNDIKAIIAAAKKL